MFLHFTPTDGSGFVYSLQTTATNINRVAVYVPILVMGVFYLKKNELFSQSSSLTARYANVLHQIWFSIARHPDDIWVNMERRRSGTDRGTPKDSEEMLSQCHFPLHIAHGLIDWAWSREFEVRSWRLSRVSYGAVLVLINRMQSPHPDWDGGRF
jgi:hypothetical protein